MTPQNRWIQDAAPKHDGLVPYPANARLEVTYLTDPELHAQVLPPPLGPAPEPRVRVHFTRIEVDGHLHEIVCSFLLDATYDGGVGQFCAVMPIDLETAVSPSRETYGEPKKLAQLEFERAGDRVRASVTRQGVTIIEVAGDVTATMPVPAPYDVRQFWYKFLPAVSGEGFDAGPFLVTLHQTMKPETCERVDGKLVLRELPGTPVADLPVLEMEGCRFMMTSSEFFHVLENVDIDPVEYSRHVRVQYT